MSRSRRLRQAARRDSRADPRAVAGVAPGRARPGRRLIGPGGLMPTLIRPGWVVVSRDGQAVMAVLRLVGPQDTASGVEFPGTPQAVVTTRIGSSLLYLHEEQTAAQVRRVWEDSWMEAKLLPHLADARCVAPVPGMREPGVVVHARGRPGGVGGAGPHQRGHAAVSADPVRAPRVRGPRRPRLRRLPADLPPRARPGPGGVRHQPGHVHRPGRSAGRGQRRVHPTPDAGRARPPPPRQYAPPASSPTAARAVEGGRAP